RGLLLLARELERLLVSTLRQLEELGSLHEAPVSSASSSNRSGRLDKRERASVQRMTGAKRTDNMPNPADDFKHIPLEPDGVDPAVLRPLRNERVRFSHVRRALA